LQGEEEWGEGGGRLEDGGRTGGGWGGAQNTDQIGYMYLFSHVNIHTDVSSHKQHDVKKKWTQLLTNPSVK